MTMRKNKFWCPPKLCQSIEILFQKGCRDSSSPLPLPTSPLRGEYQSRVLSTNYLAYQKYHYYQLWKIKISLTNDQKSNSSSINSQNYKDKFNQLSIIEYIIVHQWSKIKIIINLPMKYHLQGKVHNQSIEKSAPTDTSPAGKMPPRTGRPKECHTIL